MTDVAPNPDAAFNQAAQAYATAYTEWKAAVRSSAVINDKWSQIASAAEQRASDAYAAYMAANQALDDLARQQAETTIDQSIADITASTFPPDARPQAL